MSPLPPTDGWTSVARLHRQFARRRQVTKVKDYYALILVASTSQFQRYLWQGYSSHFCLPYHPTTVARLRRQFARRRREGRGGQLFTPYPPTIYTPICYDYFRPQFIFNLAPGNMLFKI